MNEAERAEAAGGELAGERARTLVVVATAGRRFVLAVDRLLDFLAEAQAKVVPTRGSRPRAMISWHALAVPLVDLGHGAGAQPAAAVVSVAGKPLAIRAAAAERARRVCEADGAPVDAADDRERRVIADGAEATMLPLSAVLRAL